MTRTAKVSNAIDAIICFRGPTICRSASELAIDQSLKAIEALDDQVDPIENAVIENATPQELEGNTSDRAARPFSFTRSFPPGGRCSTSWPVILYQPIQPKFRVYFRDLYDHVGADPRYFGEPARPDLRHSRNLPLGALNRTNDIMKTLTIVTVMFMPMSFIVGFFGMNFFADSLAFQEAELPKSLLFWGLERDHGDFTLFYLDLRAAKKWF